ncbi:MAG: hypothetical protein RLZZ299_89 [Pseudomonadota bacterium]|jgi:hypothetical protein
MRLGLLLPLALTACVVRGHHDGPPEPPREGQRRGIEDSLDYTSTSTGTGASTGTPADTAEDIDTDCATTPLHVVSVRATPVAAPWVPGGEVTVVARLENRGDTDVLDYPGVHVTSDSADVTTTQDPQYLYGLFAGQALDLSLTFLASASAAPGTVTFTAEATALHCADSGRCPPPCPVTTTLDLLAPGR